MKLNAYQLPKLQQYYKEYRRNVLVMLLFLIAAFAAAFVYRPMILPILAVALIWHFKVLHPSQQLYTDGVNQANLERTVCQKLAMSSLTIDDLVPVTPEIIERAGLMPCSDEKSSPLLLWGIYGEKRDFRLAMCDATIPQNFRLSEKGKRRVHFNSGVWVHIDLPVDTQLHYKLLDETSVPTPIRMDYFAKHWGNETAPIDDPDVAKRFVLYRPKNTDQHPSPAVLKSLKDLMEYTPGYVALSIHGSQLDVFVRGRFLARPVSVSKPPTEEVLDFDPFPELGYIVRLATAIEREAEN